MLVKFLERVKLRVYRGNEETFSLHQRGSIQTVDDIVGRELIKKGSAIEIPARQYGAAVAIHRFL